MKLGDQFNGGEVVRIIYTHYLKELVDIRLPDGTEERYLIKEKGVDKNELIRKGDNNA